LRDQLKKLEELQKYDAQIQELTNALQAIPAKLEATKNDLVRVEALLSNERNQLGETQRYYDGQKDLVQADETHLSSAKTKQSAAKNTKEYAAAQRELDMTRESLAARQAEIAKLVEAIQNKEKSLADRTADVQTLRASVEKDSDQAKSRMAELQGKINSLKSERDKMSSGVRADVLKRYSAIRMRKGLALAPVANGTCRGCNMNIPPQLFNVLQRGNSIETCPYCHRIIYWEELMKEPAAETAAPEKKTAAEKKAEA
jgi:predicted  nucleic acid-binding Zn-ribbon protein